MTKHFFGSQARRSVNFLYVLNTLSLLKRLEPVKAGESLITTENCLTLMGPLVIKFDMLNDNL